MKRDHWQRKIAGLDPETDFEQIMQINSYYEFPWDIQQSLSFALFRTYAVPTIGRLLYDTGEFTTDTQKRHDDTALILESVLVDGMESPKGHAAVRRMNQMHGRYEITNDDMRYVLATFVVIPVRWIRDYGWRTTTAAELTATVTYYRRLGTLMGLKDIPTDYGGFEQLLDRYETEQFVFDEKSRAVADATLALLVSFYPRILRRSVDAFSRALMDDPLREAFRFKKPSPPVIWLARSGLKLRARIERFMPARRMPVHANDLKRVTSYPGGFMVEKLGTFPSGLCTAEKHEMSDESTVA